MAYTHSHHYLNINGKPWTIRLQGEHLGEEIYVKPGKIDVDELDVGWDTIRSPYEQVNNTGLLPAIITGIEAWVDYGYLMPAQKFINTFLGR